MPLYEFVCKCGQCFEQIAPINMKEARCPKCSSLAGRIISPFHWKWFNKFTKDGEGFKSFQMSRDEYNKRIDEGSLGDYQDIGGKRNG